MLKMVKRFSREECCTLTAVTRKKDAVHSECAFPVGSMLYMVVPDLVESNAVHGNRRVHIGVGEKYGECICPLSWSVPQQTLYMMLDRVKGGWACIPPPLPARADFCIVMECTPESGHCHSECTLCGKLFPAEINDVQYMTNYLLLKEKL